MCNCKEEYRITDVVDQLDDTKVLISVCFELYEKIYKISPSEEVRMLGAVLRRVENDVTLLDEMAGQVYETVRIANGLRGPQLAA